MKKLSDSCNSIIEQIQERVCISPDTIAIKSDYNITTYSELWEKSNKLAHLLANKLTKSKVKTIGVLLKRTEKIPESILAIHKINGIYVPISTTLPVSRIISIIESANINIIITDKECYKLVSDLIESLPSLINFVFLDTSKDVFDIEKKLIRNITAYWDDISGQEDNFILSGGWINSFTREQFSEKEMCEYAENTFQKLKPYINKKCSVLEIGCSSGITMTRIASHVKKYVGIDISRNALNSAKNNASLSHIDNVHLRVLEAKDILNLKDECFDIIILNSVIQYFPNYVYLLRVIENCTFLLNRNGVLFIGDILDFQTKNEYLSSLNEMFSHANEKNTSGLNNSLFIKKDFFDKLKRTKYYFSNLHITEKKYTVENELTKYRYDCLISVNKKYTNCTTKNNTLTFLEDVLLLPSNNFINKIKDNDLAYIIFTSGSTGKPKGVKISHSNLCCFKRGIGKNIPIENCKSILAHTDYGFDIGILEYYVALTWGLTIIVASENINLNPIYLNQFIYENNIELVQVTPSQMELIIETRNFKNSFKNVKILMIGGEIFPKRLFNKLKRVQNLLVYNMYGPTETTIWITNSLIDSNNENLSIGKLFDENSYLILDENYQEVPHGEIGQLCISGNSVSPGYIDQKSTSNSFFVSKENFKIYYKTGDLVKVNNDGNLFYIGRMDNQIKLNGHRIEIEEIENTISNIPKIMQAVVIPLRDCESFRYLKAFYTATEGIVTSEEIRHHLKKILPSYMIPSEFIQVNSFKLNSNGKIDKNFLRNLNIPDALKKTEELTYVEKKIYAIWKEVLYVENFGKNENFFDIGGSSLAVARVLALIENDFNIILSFQKFYELSTVHRLADFIEKSSNKKNFQVVNPSKKLDLQDKLIYKYNLLSKSILDSNNVINIFSTTKFQEYFYQKNSATLLNCTYEFPNNIHIKLIENIITELINENPILRTIIKNDGSQIKFYSFAPKSKYHIPYFNLSKYSPAEVRKCFDKSEKQLLKNSLENRILYFICIYKNLNLNYSLEFCASHMIFDEASIHNINFQITNKLLKNANLKLGEYSAYCNMISKFNNFKKLKMFFSSEYFQGLKAVIAEANKWKIKNFPNQIILSDIKRCYISCSEINKSLDLSLEIYTRIIVAMTSLISFPVCYLINHRDIFDDSYKRVLGDMHSILFAILDKNKNNFPNLLEQLHIQVNEYEVLLAEFRISDQKYFPEEKEVLSKIPFHINFIASDSAISIDYLRQRIQKESSFLDLFRTYICIENSKIVLYFPNGISNKIESLLITEYEARFM